MVKGAVGARAIVRQHQRRAADDRCPGPDLQHGGGRGVVAVGMGAQDRGDPRRADRRQDRFDMAPAIGVGTLERRGIGGIVRGLDDHVDEGLEHRAVAGPLVLVPLAISVFCILGVPVGIVSKRSGSIGGFAVGVLVVIAYYVINVACEFLVTTLWISPFAGAWLPNVIFTIVTILWFYRVSRQ